MSYIPEGEKVIAILSGDVVAAIENSLNENAALSDAARFAGSVALENIISGDYNDVYCWEDHTSIQSPGEFLDVFDKTMQESVDRIQSLEGLLPGKITLVSLGYKVVIGTTAEVPYTFADSIHAGVAARTIINFDTDKPLRYSLIDGRIYDGIKGIAACMTGDVSANVSDIRAETYVLQDLEAIQTWFDRDISQLSSAETAPSVMAAMHYKSILLSVDGLSDESMPSWFTDNPSRIYDQYIEKVTNEFGDSQDLASELLLFTADPVFKEALDLALLVAMKCNDDQAKFNA
jgi:hypothetical protein